MVMSEHTIEQLAAYLTLIEQWNGYASLVSRADLASLVGIHLADSLSLVPVVRRTCRDDGFLLDIGSGGGFPAIPVKVTIPGLRVALIERSERKVGFLRKVVGALGLSGVTVVHGEFPQCAREMKPDVITARAVERPKQILKSILGCMPDGCSFLCQSRVDVRGLGEKFHVEHVQDEWTERGYRRGDLNILSRGE